jgi:hypothetical protein
MTTQLDYLKTLLAKQVENAGWTTENTYDRFWKKDVAETKRRIKAIEARQRPAANRKPPKRDLRK